MRGLTANPVSDDEAIAGNILWIWHGYTARNQDRCSFAEIKAPHQFPMRAGEKVVV